MRLLALSLVLLVGCSRPGSDKVLTIAVNAGVEGTALKTAAHEWGERHNTRIEVVELPYANLFEKESLDLQSRTGAYDVIMLDDPWFPKLVADLTALPFRTGAFDAALHIVTIEHLREPGRALAEIGRSLKPGGVLLVAAPHEWEVHQAPHDYFRYTCYGLAYLLESAGFEKLDIHASGGYFRLLARRLLNGLQFFTGGFRWLFFIPAAILVVPPALILPFLDFLDRDRNFTLGYICTARKRA